MCQCVAQSKQLHEFGSSTTFIWLSICGLVFHLQNAPLNCPNAQHKIIDKEIIEFVYSVSADGM
jgi:hypothetical protein